MIFISYISAQFKDNGNVDVILLQFTQTRLYMKKDSLVSTLIPNIFQLEQLPYLKKQTAQWKSFKDKQKFLPIFRTITYQSQVFMSKIFLFDIKEQVKDNKRKRQLFIFTEKQIISIQQLYQILNQNMNQKQFSEEVARIKQFELKVRKFVEAILHKNLLAFKKNEDFLVFNVYRSINQYYIKASFSSYNYRFELTEQSSNWQMPSSLRIDNLLVKEQLNKRFNNQVLMTNSIKISQDLVKAYKNFYDMTYFHYDQFMLRLQVFENHPPLRLKNYIPIRFLDHKTQKPLEGPIFSNSEPQCMFQHFIGFNADTTKNLQGDVCSICQITYDQFQENQLLMMLRDNICNPEKNDIFYCPEFNRFKIITKSLAQQQSEESMISQEEPIYKTTIKYLNYYHFRLNLKKITNKNRLTFYPSSSEEIFPLTFNLFNRQLLIMDPARGKYCQHYNFTDLRLYYLGYNQETKLYKCPIYGCHEQMADSDILYLRQVQILIQYAKYKCEKNPELLNSSKIVVDHLEKKVHLTYQSKEENSIVPLGKIDQIPQFYKTLADPFIPFAEYSLGIKDKEREEKMNEYMFGGWRGQGQQQIQEEQQEQDNDDD